MADLRMKHIRDSQAIEARGFRLGKEEGRAEGEKNKQLEIAKKLLDLEISIEQIVEATGLTEEEINSIKR